MWLEGDREFSGLERADEKVAGRCTRVAEDSCESDLGKLVSSRSESSTPDCFMRAGHLVLGNDEKVKCISSSSQSTTLKHWNL